MSAPNNPNRINALELVYEKAFEVFQKLEENAKSQVAKEVFADAETATENLYLNLLAQEYNVSPSTIMGYVNNLQTIPSQISGLEQEIAPLQANLNQLDNVTLPADQTAYDNAAELVNSDLSTIDGFFPSGLDGPTTLNVIQTIMSGLQSVINGGGDLIEIAEAQQEFNVYQGILNNIQGNLQNNDIPGSVSYLNQFVSSAQQQLVIDTEQNNADAIVQDNLNIQIANQLLNFINPGQTVINNIQAEISQTQEALNAGGDLIEMQQLQAQLATYQGILINIQGDLGTSDFQDATVYVTQFITNTQQQLATDTAQNNTAAILADNANLDAANQVLSFLLATHSNNAVAAGVQPLIAAQQAIITGGGGDLIEVQQAQEEIVILTEVQNALPSDTTDPVSYLNQLIANTQNQLLIDESNNDDNAIFIDNASLAAYSSVLSVAQTQEQSDIQSIENDEAQLQTDIVARDAAFSTLTTDQGSAASLAEQISGTSGQITTLTEELQPALNFFDGLTAAEQSEFLLMTGVQIS